MSMRSSESTRFSSSGFGSRRIWAIDMAPAPSLPESTCGPRPVLAVEHVAAGGAVDRRGLEQLPAVEDRLRVDVRRAAAGGADREVEVRRHAGDRPSDAPQERAAADVAALL